jgi:uncharacterized protein YjbI with pentapeptide repeats
MEKQPFPTLSVNSDGPELSDIGMTDEAAGTRLVYLNRRVIMMRALMYGTAALFVFVVAGTASAQQTIRGCEIKPRTGCAGGDLSGQSLLNADLAGADLSNANLTGADLRGADLYRADLSGANLSNAQLSSVILNRSDLSGANLSGTNLTGAQIRAADLSRANLSGADLSRVDLTYTNLGGAVWVDGRTCAEGSSGECK